MAKRQDKMRLGAFFNPTGHHVASWRHPRAQADAGINFQHYVEITRTAERGLFDMVFLADNVGVRRAHKDALSRSAQYIANFEPLTLLSALSAVTDRIGLACTMSTSYHEPFHIARKMASLDHLSGGRAGWNVVTSASQMEAENFGRDKPYSHADRYRRAHESVEIVRALWDSWDDDAFMRDKETGSFFDPDKLHALNHKGEFFTVKGPLNVPRSPQGYPVLIQAGASEDGMDLAASIADVVFSPHLTLDTARAYYKELKETAQKKFGRDPDSIKVLPGVSAIIGRSEAEATEEYDRLQALIHPIVAREILSLVLSGFDLAPYDMDGPLPDIPVPADGSQSHFKSTMDLARRENLTIRQLAMRVAGARGKSVIKGSPESVADQLEVWFQNRAADGFNVMPAYLPGGLDDFVDMVVPELQRRGLFRTAYEGRTLRDNLGLRRAASRYAR
jgi:alkanesulfonate monooxygenase